MRSPQDGDSRLAGKRGATVGCPDVRAPTEHDQATLRLKK